MVRVRGGYIVGPRGGVPLLRVPASLLRVYKNLYRVEPDPSILPNSEYNVMKIERNAINLSSLPVQSHPPIRRKKAPNLTCDQRCDVQLLCSLSWKYNDIHKFTSFEISQI